MKFNANKSVKAAALLGACACIAFTAYIVSRELGYLRAKINGPEGGSSPAIPLLWPDRDTSLMKLQVSLPRTELHRDAE